MKPAQRPRKKAASPFLAIPTVVDGVEARTAPDGTIQLRRLEPERDGFAGRIQRLLGQRRQQRVDLDARGTAFWKLVNGRRNLAEIESRLRREFEIDEQACRDSVVLFTKMLMRRGMLALDLTYRKEAA